MKKNHGQSLIEVLAALAMAALVILGIVKATTVSVKNANYSQGQTEAVSLAQKKITEIIADKNSSPVDFFGSLPLSSKEIIGQFCLKTTVTDVPTTTPPGAKMAKITVIVYWGESGIGTDCIDKDYFHNYQVETNVTN